MGAPAAPGPSLRSAACSRVRPHPQMLVYGGTKAAEAQLGGTPARQFGGQGVTVNNLAPAPF